MGILRVLIVSFFALPGMALQADAQDAVDVSVGDNLGCALYSDGSVYCWGNLAGDLPLVPYAAWRVGGLPSAEVIAVGRLGACAIDTDGQLWCWGADLQRNLRGAGFFASRSPSMVEGIPRVSDVAMGFNHQCAIGADVGDVWCWGSNPCGEVGCGDTERRSEPTRVLYVEDAISVSTGVNNTCVALSDGLLSCWGSDNPTRPGDEFAFESSEPLIFDAAAIDDLVQVANGRNFACGLRNDGRVTCWGSNIMGQIGSHAPRLSDLRAGIGEVDGIADATDIDATYFDACAVQDGDVFCWGGLDPSEMGDRPQLVNRRQFGGATRVSVGDPMACAVVNGRVLCWIVYEDYDGVELIPGMAYATPVGVPGLPGEIPASSVVQRPTVGPDTVDDLLRDGYFELAQRWAQGLRGFDPANAMLRELEATAYYRLAREASDAGQDDEALRLLTNAIEVSEQEHAGAFNDRGLIHAARGELGLALMDIERALEIAPESSLYHSNRCAFLRLDGQLDRALQDCNAAVSLELPASRENRSWVYAQRGITKSMMGDIEGALGDFRNALENATESSIQRLQQIMNQSQLYDGSIDGVPNEELLSAFGACIASEECFAAMAEQTDNFMELEF